MNLLLFEPDELSHPRGATPRVRVTGERLRHLRSVLGVAAGDELEVGVVGGRLGRGVVETVGDDAAVLALELDRDPPAPLDVELVLALPRPPMLRRVLAAVTSLGVKRIDLLQTARVEKSYWQSSALEPDAIARQLRLGLEQARDTVLPKVELRRRFRPFVEDDLAPRLERRRGLVAEVLFERPCPVGIEEPTTLLVGPEGGFVQFELELLQEAGAAGISLGSRALRVETAVIALLSRLGAKGT